MGLMLDFDRPFSAEDAASFHEFIGGLQARLVGPHYLERGVSPRDALDIFEALELARKLSAWVTDEVLNEGAWK